MRTLLRTSTPWLVAAITAALCVSFWLPFGSGAANITTYDPFANVVASFGRPKAPPPAAAASAQETSSARTAPWIGPSSEQPRQASPRALTRSHSSRTKRERPIRPPAPTVAVTASTAAAHASPPEPIDKRSDAPSPIEGVPQAASRQPVLAPEDDSSDGIRDAFEGSDSKYPMDTRSAADRVTLRLAGICRWRGHYVVKVAVGNQSGSDFFVRELSAYDGSDYITIKSYFRLLVEPGRSREGFVLFDARSGAQVKLKLKEDRENGRALELPVRYPF